MEGKCPERRQNAKQHWFGHFLTLDGSATPREGDKFARCNLMLMNYCQWCLGFPCIKTNVVEGYHKFP